MPCLCYCGLFNANIFSFINLVMSCGLPIMNIFAIFFFLALLFQDIELSKEINESFKQSSQARTKLPSGIEMSVHVLTTG